MCERLVGDIGGTNARLAVLDKEGKPVDAVTYTCNDFPGPLETIQTFMKEREIDSISDAVIAVATPVTSDTVNLTNNHWCFSIAEMEHTLGLETGRFQVINDFKALALSVPHLKSGDVSKIGRGEPLAERAIAVIGPGTGLGVSGLVPTPAGGWVALQGEGGHVSIGVRTEREIAIYELLNDRFRHVSAERFLSGDGLSNIANALREIDKLEPREMTPAQISEKGISGEDPVCLEALNIFSEMLGSCAGNLALTLGSEGGVYVGGGIVPRLGDWFAQSNFRDRFEAKGRMSGLLASIPTYVIVAPYPALIGAASLLNDN